MKALFKEIAEHEYIEQRGYIAEVIRKPRTKTARLQVEGGAVSIVVPIALPQTRIKKILTDKNRWIKEKIYLHQQVTQPVISKEFISGEAFPYLGRNYRLKIEAGRIKKETDGIAVKLKQGRLVVTLAKKNRIPEFIQAALVQWYQNQALIRIKEKVDRHAKIIGVSPKSISIKNFKSRWGNCTKQGAIQFNWKIILAPHRIVDYIIIHELCHLKHHNHSPKFWKSLERYIPNYLECKTWLRMEGSSLDIK